jgi:tetratricopeptide (TPR) repeat protein
MVLYMREKQYDFALRMAEQLHARYPENFILHLNRAQILEKLERREAAVETFLEVIEKNEAGVANYQKLDVSRLRFPLGERLLAVDRREQALEQFEAARANDDTPESDRVRSSLRAGEILESQGRYQEAERRYREVQRLDDVDGSHRSATRRLRGLDNR